MNENIRKLLILQDRDMKFLRLEDELESLDPEREATKRESLNRQQVLEHLLNLGQAFVVKRRQHLHSLKAGKLLIEHLASTGGEVGAFSSWLSIVDSSLPRLAHRHIVG